ncbi:hypothetical protein K239x_55430 [Planctomycetes bacterium K23_9]|uniref:Uncharacterized protein n=1 Tax=Stieleria marina TaxID=1930275 RepID=A0A517P2D9_9BACT|nr:hypothetical protein K239x_55430 [Planctomycetes bacterium K23_9]
MLALKIAESPRITAHLSCRLKCEKSDDHRESAGLSELEAKRRDGYVAYVKLRPVPATVAPIWARCL